MFYNPASWLFTMPDFFMLPGNVPVISVAWLFKTGYIRAKF